MQIVVTAGGTREPIDDVRHVSNVASGSLPAAIANVLLREGATVHYIHGPGAALPGRVTIEAQLSDVGDALPASLASQAQRATATLRALANGTLHLHPIQTAAEAEQTLQSVVATTQPDAVLCAMAVADYAPVPAAGKVSSQLGEMTVRMRPTGKTIDVVKGACPSATLFGFKLLSGASWEQRASACKTLAERSGADFVICNDMLDYRQGIRRAWLYDARGEVVQNLEDPGFSLQGLAEAIAAVVARSQK